MAGQNTGSADHEKHDATDVVSERRDGRATGAERSAPPRVRGVPSRREMQVNAIMTLEMRAAQAKCLRDRERDHEVRSRRSMLVEGIAADLKPLDFAILGECAISRLGISPYEIAKLHDEGIVGLAGRSVGQMYKRIKKLAKIDLLEAEVEDCDPDRPGSGRTVYSLTALGLRVLEEWSTFPIEVPRTDLNDLIPRVRTINYAGAYNSQKRFEEFEEAVRDAIDDLSMHERLLRKDATLQRG